MPTSTNQKLKLLYLVKILMEKTDEHHPLSMPNILDELASYGISAERKSIYSDFKLLDHYGIEVLYRRAKGRGYYIDQRQFELAELKLLADAVASSHFITAKKSEGLITKLGSLTSKHQAKQLQRQIYVNNRPKTINESIYYNVDAIHTAINTNKEINFKYFDYDLDKEKVYRKKGNFYNHTPVTLCWNEDRYYLICYNSKYDAYTHYRVDRMSNVEVSEVEADPRHRKFDVVNYVKQHFGMFGGDTVQAHLRFNRSLTNQIFDRFGTGVFISHKGDYFEIHVDIATSPVFLAWLAQFGNKAEILGPSELRSAMQGFLTELNSVYKK